jgi:hypothetical protein
MIYCIIWANKERIILANIISFWLNNKCKVVRHATPVTMSQWIRGWSFSTEYRYHLMDDLPGKVGGAFIQDPRRLCL